MWFRPPQYPILAPGPLKARLYSGQSHLAEPPSETLATLPAAAAPLVGTVNDPLAASGGWVGALAPRGAVPRSRAFAALEMQAHRGPGSLGLG